MLTPVETADFAIDALTHKATTPWRRDLLLAMAAGAFIGIGFVFYLVTQQGADAMPVGMAKFVGGVAFSTGLALVVITGADLFTSTTMTLTSRAAGRITWGRLLRHWGLVYGGNLVGALTLAVLLFWGGTYENGTFGAVALTTAHHKVSHTFVQALVLGLLCNFLVCIAVWASYAGRTVVDKVAAITLPIAMFVAAGFEHSVANMFLLPYAMMLKTLVPAEFWAAAGIAAADLDHLTWARVVVGNLLPVTIGNIIGGGVMVGLHQAWAQGRIGRR